MASLRSPRRNPGSTQSEEFRPEGGQTPVSPFGGVQAQPDNMFEGPSSRRPQPQIPIPDVQMPIPGGGQEGDGGGGLGIGPREGSVGNRAPGGAGVRSITTPRVPTPFSGGQVGLSGGTVPPPSSVGLRSLLTPNEPAPFSTAPNRVGMGDGTPRNVDIFSGGRGGLFGEAGGLQGGGLGVPGTSAGVNNPSALIQALLKILGGG